MEVILLESFDKLGKIGDVVKVKNGFARNFLFPKNKALRANKENKEKFLNIKNDLIKKNDTVIEESKKVLEKIEKEEILFIRNASDNGQLYGSVSPKDISSYFADKKIDIKPSNINLHTSIKKIGIYELNVKLHAEVGCNLKINVATSEQNAIKQREESEKNKNIKDENEKILSESDSKETDINPKENKVSSENPKSLSNQQSPKSNDDETKEVSEVSKKDK
ncbi:MAG: 50S ribosomal protein L9 [Alphaproteobacteria bacterium]